MAQEFIGYTILVTLQSPPWWPNAQVQGVVANVVNQKLFLQDGVSFQCLLLVRHTD